ncbi:uncharacterized protein J3R85_003994 [Psidium guajava]|nr:uncharacterized protein J3R85_003994 [Psidium guajava]
MAIAPPSSWSLPLHFGTLSFSSQAKGIEVKDLLEFPKLVNISISLQLAMPRTAEEPRALFSQPILIPGNQ